MKTSKCYSLSRVQLFEALWTVTHQAPLSMEFSRQEYWSGLPFPSPVDLPHPGIERRSPAFQADSLLSEPLGKPIVHGLFQVYMEVSLGSIYSWPGDFAYLFPERHDK